ncbi:unnamed protein product [Cylicocyclus nassatus]|uniref:Reverse transcriptase domain-containing protein n=1 Tax=Cylicocyclus nassatus TaxID=53992 RepID=A0AA36H4N6_CYLNA|nr:unnamed protein product [Cylicocyclus nassatus]
MGDKSLTTPEPEDDVVQMSKEYFDLLVAQVAAARHNSTTQESPKQQESAQYPILQDGETRTNLQRAITLLTQRNELLVVADSDPDVFKFFEQQSKADSMQVSSPILAAFFRDKKKKEERKQPAQPRKWRSAGINIAVYLDDGLLWSDSARECEEAVSVVRADLRHAGFSTAEAKCSWIPIQRMIWLGHEIDLAEMTLNVTRERRERARLLAKRILRMKGPPLWDRLRWQGTLASMHLVIPLDLRKRWKAVVSQVAEKESLGTAMSFKWALTSQEKAEIQAWLEFDASFGGAPISAIAGVSNALRAFSDASDSGVGAILYLSWTEKLCASANLPPELVGSSSTARELFAILFGLRSFAEHFRLEQVVWHCDNQPVVGILNKGSTKPHLQRMAECIWDFGARIQLNMDFSWIAREFNSEADLTSRMLDLDDRSIREEVSAQLQEIWGVCTLDFFASQNSKKCAAFISREASSEAVMNDAFSPEASRLWESVCLVGPPT